MPCFPVAYSANKLNKIRSWTSVMWMKFQFDEPATHTRARALSTFSAWLFFSVDYIFCHRLQSRVYTNLAQHFAMELMVCAIKCRAVPYNNRNDNKTWNVPADDHVHERLCYVMAAKCGIWITITLARRNEHTKCAYSMMKQPNMIYSKFEFVWMSKKNLKPVAVAYRNIL